jgi:hypothetical protein
MQNRPGRAIFRLLAFAACLFAAACGAVVAPDHGLAPERTAQLGQICSETMQLTRGTTHFEDCMEALSETARKLDQARARP